MRQWVLDAEHILSADWVGEGVVGTNAMVAQRFDAWREGLTRQLTQDDLSSLQQQCLEQFLQVLSNQRCHLIQCYEHTDFPRTTNEMERQDSQAQDPVSPHHWPQELEQLLDSGMEDAWPSTIGGSKMHSDHNNFCSRRLISIE